VSDIHCCLNHVHDVAEYLKNYHANLKIDFILNGGDIVNLKGEDYVKKESLEKATSEITAINLALEQICPNVIYIPGNVR